MHFQFIVAPPTPTLTPPSPPAADSSAELLRQLLDIQRAQLDLMQATNAANGDNSSTRWRSFFQRWHQEFPNLPGDFRGVLPTVERAFLRLMSDLLEHLKSEESNGLDDDFSLGEFLDRYAIRANQIGSVLNLLGQMAEAGRSDE